MIESPRPFARPARLGELGRNLTFLLFRSAAFASAQ